MEQNDKWLEGMKTEMEILYKTEIWDLVQKEKGRNIIPGRWVYKINMSQTEILISLQRVV